MKVKNFPVYSADKKTLIVHVSSKLTSIGAAKKANVKSCKFGFKVNQPCWFEVKA
tara:strand:+ start:292 stop:456 length:165 start_codon:yes stop_codon:yes gene_type:complete